MNPKWSSEGQNKRYVCLPKRIHQTPFTGAYIVGKIYDGGKGHSQNP